MQALPAHSNGVRKAGQMASNTRSYAVLRSACCRLHRGEPCWQLSDCTYCGGCNCVIRPSIPDLANARSFLLINDRLELMDLGFTVSMMSLAVMCQVILCVDQYLARVCIKARLTS